MSNNIIVLLSGGLDSSTLFKYVKIKMGYTPIAIFFDRHQGAIEEELEAAKWVCRGLKDQPYIVSIRDWRDASPNVPMEYIPRNAIMILLSVPYAQANDCTRIAIGSNLDDEGTPDSSKRFVHVINELLKVTVGNIEVIAPFIENRMKKSDVVRWAYHELGPDFINKTFSCFRPDKGKPCKACSGCRSRVGAIDESGINIKI